MKRFVNALLLLVMCSALLSLPIETTFAQQVTSPSVRAAARLKHNPPKNWIRHYLPDDRYKIAGGVWKVVSTELDRYYYPAWAPEMLRQKPGIVIGFSSIAEAEEAGYMPSAYPMGESLYGLTPVEIVAAKQRAAAKPIQGRRIFLADGKSSVILPPGWRVLQSQPTSASRKSTSDLLIYGNNEGQGLLILTRVLPSNADPSRELTVEHMKRGISDMLKDPKKDAAVKEMLLKTTIHSAQLGGRPAVIRREGESRFSKPTLAIMTSRGSKLYWFQLPAATEKAPGFSTIVNSFQPR